MNENECVHRDALSQTRMAIISWRPSGYGGGYVKLSVLEDMYIYRIRKVRQLDWDGENLTREARTR